MLERIYFLLLSHLPYYLKDQNRRILDKGIKVPGGITRSRIPIIPELNLLVCTANVGAGGIAGEVRALMGPSSKVDIHIVQDSRGGDNDLLNPDMGDNDVHRTKMDATEDEQLCGSSHDIGQHDGERYLYDLSIDTKKSTESSLLLPQGGGIPEIEQSQDNMSHGDISYEVDLMEAASHDKFMNRLVGDEHDDDLSDGSLSQDNNQTRNNEDRNISHSSRAQYLGNAYFVADEIDPFTIREITEFDPASIEKQCILLLYLNKDTFLDEGNMLQKVVQSAKGLKINIILIHEDDNGSGGCPFSLFFKQAPQVLIEPPHVLFQEMAIPLYSTLEYRRVSMRKIIDRIFDSDLSDEV